MPDLSQLIQQGSHNLWLFIPTAIVLGALHGLEPGHSKTMMAAFIVAVRGTVKQAILLGLAATVSHTIVVWAIALGGLYLAGGKFQADATEPFFQIASGVAIILIAVWMLYRTWREQHADQHHHHSHDDIKVVNTGHGSVQLQIFEAGQPPRFRLSAVPGAKPTVLKESEIVIESMRPDGATQLFQFERKDGFLESKDIVPEPHEFIAQLRIGHGDHKHDFDIQFSEHHHHEVGLEPDDEGYQDAHERAHASEIQRRFAGQQNITTWQIVLFGLTGGLIPCPASITVLLLCLQLKQIPLGALLVLCFSIGLALTMVSSGVLAALSIKHVSKRWSGFGEFARKAPYFSSAVIVLIGLIVIWAGAKTLIS